MRHEIQTRDIPIRLVIDIETKEDLCDLLSRLNASEESINTHLNIGVDYKFGANSHSTYHLWDALDDLAADLGLQAEVVE